MLISSECSLWQEHEKIKESVLDKKLKEMEKSPEDIRDDIEDTYLSIYRSLCVANMSPINNDMVLSDEIPLLFRGAEDWDSMRGISDLYLDRSHQDGWMTRRVEGRTISPLSHPWQKRKSFLFSFPQFPEMSSQCSSGERCPVLVFGSAVACSICTS